MSLYLIHLRRTPLGINEEKFCSISISASVQGIDVVFSDFTSRRDLKAFFFDFGLRKSEPLILKKRIR